MRQIFRMLIQKYLPEKLYGFAATPDGTRQVFFHLGTFDPGKEWPTHPRCASCPRKGCSWPETAPPPVLGEPVDVDVDLDDAAVTEGRSPRAFRVVRAEAPKVLVGKVDVFDARRGYGFVVDDDGNSHHLHRSEVLEGKIPLPGRSVVFFAGQRQGRSRACHVKVCP